MKNWVCQSISYVKHCFLIEYNSFSDIEENIPLVIKLDYGLYNTEYKKMREAYKYIYKHNLNDFDWILKAKDDSYIVMENLRHMLYQYQADWPIQIGQRFLTQV